MFEFDHSYLCIQTAVLPVRIFRLNTWVETFGGSILTLIGFDSYNLQLMENTD